MHYNLSKPNKAVHVKIDLAFLLSIPSTANSYKPSIQVDTSWIPFLKVSATELSEPIVARPEPHKSQTIGKNEGWLI